MKTREEALAEAFIRVYRDSVQANTKTKATRWNYPAERDAYLRLKGVRDGDASVNSYAEVGDHAGVSIYLCWRTSQR
jgi:hypothetical protein